MLGNKLLIHDAALLVPCCTKTLRRLDARGVVCPARDTRGWRVYTMVEIDQARKYLEQGRRKK